MRSALLTIIACLCLSGCITTYDSQQAYLDKKGIAPPAPEVFAHCQAYGCKIVSQITLEKTEWRAIEKLFRPRPKTATDERKIIAKAIGLFEEFTATKTATNDHYGTFRDFGDDQHDCVDESTNTTIYLNLLEQKKLMRFHQTQAPQVRIVGWPHQTAVIAETESGEKFAVDSWFHDNGFPAEIAPFATWKDGWKPETHLTNPQPPHAQQ